MNFRVAPYEALVHGGRLAWFKNGLVFMIPRNEYVLHFGILNLHVTYKTTTVKTLGNQSMSRAQTREGIKLL